jgi:hypothetical protein
MLELAKRLLERGKLKSRHASALYCDTAALRGDSGGIGDQSIGLPLVDVRVGRFILRTCGAAPDAQ